MTWLDPQDVARRIRVLGCSGPCCQQLPGRSPTGRSSDQLAAGLFDLDLDQVFDLGLAAKRGQDTAQPALRIKGHDAVGAVLVVGGENRGYFAGLDVVSGDANDWNANANNRVETLAIAGDQLYAGGSFGRRANPHSDFVTEAEESLDRIDPLFVELETNGEDKEILNDIFRCMHTLKGAAGFLGFQPVVDVAHTSENILKRLREGEVALTKRIVERAAGAATQADVDELVKGLELPVK